MAASRPRIVCLLLSSQTGFGGKGSFIFSFWGKEKWFFHQLFKQNQLLCLFLQRNNQIHLETTSLRLYLLNIDAKILILGNGGLKTTTTYQEDALLHKCVQTLQKIDIQMKQMEKRRVITVTGTKLLGTLTFSIDD